jgi:uncharacterized RDD family membrane protein YckC
LKRNINVNDFIESHNERIKKEITTEQVQLQSVSSGLRLVHMLIDGVISIIIMSIFLLIPTILFKAIPTRSSELIQLVTYISMGIGYFGYYYVMESKLQKTFGKYVTGTKVVNIHGEKPSNNEIINRTFCRLIPFDRLSFLFMKNGFHDNLSKTLVIKDVPKIDVPEEVK